ncbi:transcriptional regulator [Pseudomonas syringae]|nr:transcriptional regulator [Pseudomonas syringae]MBD8803172.1 transcriptional regulator [Pseudomonas syringae]MBD8813992.1 transcriptional regulator [Pseudomonas syringae]
MPRWYLITHNYQAHQQLSDRLDALGVEIYSPAKITVKRRSDSSGVRTTRTQLFPGYIFLRLDPERVHHSVIASLSGVKEFVRFGTEICTVSDSLIDALRQSLHLCSNKKITQIEFSNISTDLVKALEVITQIDSSPARQVALLSILQKDIEVRKGLENKHSCVSVIVEKTFINDLIN